MAKFVFPTEKWADEISKEFKIADDHLFGIMRMALYDGADVLADKGRAAAEAHGLGGGFGVAKMVTGTDGVQTSVGFRDGGYFTNRWGQEVPYDLAANLLEYGTRDGTRPATHFMSRAYKSAKAEAQAAMRQTFQNAIQRILGE